MRSLPLIRTKAVPWLALVLGVVAIGVISLLEHRTHASRHSELTLLTVKVELNQLQGAPFRANARAGGSPALASGQMRTGKRLIGTQLAELRGRPAPPPALRDMQPLLRANFATLDQIYAVGISAAGYDGRADRLGKVASGSAGSIETMLDAASHDYERQAVRSQNQAGVGSAGVILLLLLAFGVYYRRAARERAVSAGLAQENERLLAASRQEALTDDLTGLGNRRALVTDLDNEVRRASDDRPQLLALFDLDGFKQYNDSFGHPAGDALLLRLAERLKAATEGLGSVYRMGGDEFCLLAAVAPGEGEALVLQAAEALSDTADAFEISCSHGLARIPAEAATPEEALRLADQRMYTHKAGRPPERDSADLLQVITERRAGLGEHSTGIARLAGDTAVLLGLPEQEVRRIRLAAELHDIGTTEIPLGASIIAVCDAFDAMVSDRPYREALSLADAMAELRSGAGTQFHAGVVEAFCTLVGQSAPAAVA